MRQQRVEPYALIQLEAPTIRCAQRWSVTVAEVQVLTTKQTDVIMRSVPFTFLSILPPSCLMCVHLAIQHNEGTWYRHNKKGFRTW